MARERVDGEQKKVRSRIVDKEVDTQAHDELFLWLLSSINPVLHKLGDLAPADVSLEGAKAIERYRHSIESELATTEGLEEQHGSNAAIVEALQVKAKELAQLQVPQLDPSAFGVAEIVEWSAQHPVHEPRGNRGTVQELTKVAGFVDVRAKITVLDFLELSTPWRPAGLEYDPDGESVLFESQEKADDRVMYAIRQWDIEAPKWSHVPSSRVLWMEVRLPGFNLGALLRDLKVLRGYAENENAAVAVVTEGCPPEQKLVLEHEGFSVIDRADWP